MPLSHLDPFTRHPLVFLTVCTARRAPILNRAPVHEILLKLWRDSRMHNGWCVGRYVVMPDHVHLFARPDLNPHPMASWVATWKALSGRLLVKGSHTTAPVWQRDHFDRYLRTTESCVDKWDYVCNNPVRAGLVSKAEDWPYQGVIHDLGP